MKLNELDKGVGVTQAQLDALEKVLDQVFAKVGIDIEFTRHFIDRVNDERNIKPISIKELAMLFKKEFIKNMTERFRPALWNRDIGDGHVYQCPDQSIIGLSFAEIAKHRNIHVAEVFVDLLVEYGNQLIWKLVIGNERDDAINELYADRTGSNLMSFSDAGAHIQNMANYNFPLQMLARLKNMRKNGLETISDEHAIHRLSGELADWHGIDTGYIKKGARADINVINPENLHRSLDSIVEADFDGIENFTRLVNRNDGIVNSVLINGKVAVRDDQCVETLGKSMGYGSFLRAS